MSLLPVDKGVVSVLSVVDEVEAPTVPANFVRMSVMCAHPLISTKTFQVCERRV